MLSVCVLSGGHGALGGGRGEREKDPGEGWGTTGPTSAGATDAPGSGVHVFFVPALLP